MNFKGLKLLSLFLLLNSMGCPRETSFSDKALADTFLTVDGEDVSFRSILEENHGKVVLLDIWASWCKDCIVGIPEIKKLMAQYPDISLVYISIDRDEKSWKNGIQRFDLNDGQHYWAPKGWKSDLFEYIDLDWIPRYMILDETGEIKLYEAIKASDSNIKRQIGALKNTEKP